MKCGRRWRFATYNRGHRSISSRRAGCSPSSILVEFDRTPLAPVASEIGKCDADHPNKRPRFAIRRNEKEYAGTRETSGESARLDDCRNSWDFYRVPSINWASRQFHRQTLRRFGANLPSVIWRRASSVWADGQGKYPGCYCAMHRVRICCRCSHAASYFTETWLFCLGHCRYCNGNSCSFKSIKISPGSNCVALANSMGRSFPPRMGNIPQTPILRAGKDHSHSIVPGGFDVTSYTTRLMPFTSLIIRVATRPSTSCGNGKKSAVMPSVEVTARKAHTLS